MNSRGRAIVTDPKAQGADPSLPAFMARPADAPIYHGFPIIEESATDGWRYGAITAFEGAEGEDGGDGFVIAPDGSRAGVVWSLTNPTFEEISPPEKGRWGVNGVRFPKRVTSKQDLIENFRAVLPLFKAQYERIKRKG